VTTRRVRDLRHGERGWVAHCALFQTGAPDDYAAAYHINSNYPVSANEQDGCVWVQRVAGGIEVTVPDRYMVRWPHIEAREADWGNPLPVVAIKVNDADTGT
jgi:hypothetical protein